MIGIDTNVIMRYIAQDDAAQSARATRLIEGECSPVAPGFVALVVLVETVWVRTDGFQLLPRFRSTAETPSSDSA